MQKTTLFLFLIICSFANAQNFEWLVRPETANGGNPDGLGYPVTTDNNGHIYMAGFKEDPLLYTETFGTVFLNKYDYSGTLLHSTTIGGYALVHDMACDADGNIIVCAGYVGSILIDDIALLTTNQGVQFIVIKYSPNGERLWYHQLEMYDEDTFVNDFRAITTDSAGNIYIGYDSYSDSRIEKISPQGNVLMTIEQENVKLLSSLSVDNAGNIYAAGSCPENNATYAGVLQPTEFDYNTFVVKYNPNGVYQWVKYVNDITCTSPQVKVKTPDAVYFSSYLFGSYNFDFIVAEGPQNGFFSDFFITKLNESGNFQWMREVPGAGEASVGKRNFLTLDDNGNVYFAGATRGAIEWDLQHATTTAQFADDALVLKYNADGEMQLAAIAGGAHYDRLDGITVDDSGAIYVSGMANGSATFGNLSQQAGEYEYYPFLTKITQLPLEIPQQENAVLKLYPNPAENVVYFGNQTTIHGNIFNTIGQKISNFTIEANESLSISDLANGAYFIKIEGNKTFPLIKK